METTPQQSTPKKGVLATVREEGLKNTLIQFIKFGIVGASNTLISLAVYYLCVNVFHLHHQLANAFGFLLGVCNSYFWNSRYVFKMGRRLPFSTHAATFLRMAAGYALTGLLLTAALLWLWVDKLHISENLAPLINLVITVPLNFIINKFWAFRKKRTAEAPTADAAGEKPTEGGDGV